MTFSKPSAKHRKLAPSSDAEPAVQAREVDERAVVRILRRREVEHVTGLARSTIYQGMATGFFPSCVKIGERAVGWRESDILAWIESRPQGKRQ